MKKFFVLGLGICVAFAFASCKSSESAYKKAYEKAKQYDTAQPATAPATQEAVVAPVEAKPATQAKVVDNLDNISVRQENVQLVRGNGLNAYSVVVGSFQLQANAENLYQRLKDAGYNAQVVKNDEKQMFRVVASTFADKGSAVSSRDQLRNTYPDAWLLYNVR